MPTQKQIKQIINDLYLFYRVFIASKFRENLHAPHIQELSRHLMKNYLGKEMRICVAMPPRHSKSSMVTLAYPLWLIIHNPNLNILIVNASFSLSERFGIQLREYIREYGALFGIQLSRAKQSATTLMFEDLNGKLYNGSIRLMGANATITGMDADYVIIDDIIKNEEDTTPSALDKTYQWFQHVLLQRLEPQTRLLILHTRWNSLDLQGILKKRFPDDYIFVEYPAIKEDGTPLWSQRYSIQELQKKREEVGDRMFEALYQQHPIDDITNFFKVENIRYGKPDMDTVYNVRAWDIAGSDNTHGSLNDYTAGVLVSTLSDNKSLLIHDLVYGQFGADNFKVIRDTAKMDGVNTTVLIETGVAAAGKLLYQMWEEELSGYFVERAIPINSKVDRATTFQNMVYDGKVYIDIADNETREKIIQELKGFPDAAHDDIIDAISHAVNYCKQNYLYNPEDEILIGGTIQL